MLGINVGRACLLEINGGCSCIIGINSCRTCISGNNGGSTCMLEITVEAHVCWDQMWTHIFVGRSVVAENVHQILMVDTNLCLQMDVRDQQ